VTPWAALAEERQALDARGMEVHAGATNNMDHHYRQIIDFLKDIGMYGNTVILLLSNNDSNT
jgi:arylsulfatase A-like enzyme